jgi:amino acid adenylation domain-containing protein
MSAAVAASCGHVVLASRVRGRIEIGQLRLALKAVLRVGGVTDDGREADGHGNRLPAELRVLRCERRLVEQTIAAEAARFADGADAQLSACLLRIDPHHHVLVFLVRRELLQALSLPELIRQFSQAYLPGEPGDPAPAEARPASPVPPTPPVPPAPAGPGIEFDRFRLLTAGVTSALTELAIAEGVGPSAPYVAVAGLAIGAEAGREVQVRSLGESGAVRTTCWRADERISFRQLLHRVRDGSCSGASLADHVTAPPDAVVEYFPSWPDLRLAGLSCHPLVLVDIPDPEWSVITFASGPGLVRISVPGRRGGLERGAAMSFDRLQAILGLGCTHPDEPVTAAIRAEADADQAGRACLHELFEHQAERHPDAVAVSDEKASLTYRELNDRADRLARTLSQLGVPAGSRVGVCVGRSVELVVALLGVLKAGATYVPLDPSYPDASLALVAEDTKCKVVVCTPESAVRVPPFCAAVDVGASHAPGATLPRISPSAAAYVIYTSGSTGRPKGVVVTHENVVRLFTATSSVFDFGPADVWSLYHSCAFDFSVWEMWGALLHGGRIVVVPYIVSRSPGAFLDLLQREHVTVLSQTPTAFRELATVSARSGHPDLPLRFVVFGGERLDPAILRDWFAARGGSGPQLVNMYGITETTVHVTAHIVTAADAQGHRSTIGSPLSGMTITLCDEQMQPVPPGTQGEIIVGGLGVTRGYLNRPGLTADRFVPDPRGRPGSRAYRSGDFAVLDQDGRLVFLGRRDSQVKIRGYRIEVGEIEAALREMPAVAESVVVRRDGPHQTDQLVAYVVARDGCSLDSSSMRAFLARRLAPHLVPAAFVQLAALPMTSNGKLDRSALTAGGGVEKVRPGTRPGLARPGADAQQALAEAWQRVLGIRSASAGDNFFELGGDSILALRVIEEAQSGGFDISFESIFETATLGELATRARATTGSSPVGVISSAGPFDLSAMQAGMVYDTLMQAERRVYHDMLSAEVTGEFSADALRRALAALADRHELLRARFDLGSRGGPKQQILPHALIPLELADWSGQSPGQQRESTEQLEERILDRPFDWSRPPLMRCLAVRRSDTSFRLSLATHHSIADGWSFSRLATDLLLLYARELGEEQELRQLPTAGFQDFVALERAAAASPEATAYWTRELDSASPTRFSDAADPPGPERVTISLPPAGVANLRRLAAAAGLPLKSMFLAAHVAALADVCGRQEVVTGVVTNGRPEVPGADLLVGMYLNSLPVRIICAPDLTQTARAAFAAERMLLPYRRYPLSRLVQQQGSMPFHVLFNYTHFHVYDELRQAMRVRVRDWAYRDRPYIPLAVECTIGSLKDDVRIKLTRWPGLVSFSSMNELATAIERRIAEFA